MTPRPRRFRPLVLLGAVTAVAVTIAVLTLLGGSDPSKGEPRLPTRTAAAPPPPATTTPATTPTTTTPIAPAPAPTVTAARMIGQKIMVGFREQPTPPPALLRAIRRGHVGGVILFGENDGAGRGYASVVERLQAAAAAGGNPPLLIAIDQEGGDVRRISAAPPTLSPREMGRAGAAVSRQQGLDAGRALRRRGINVDLAPVADVPSSSASFLGTRAFGTDPAVVGRTAAAFATGLQRAGVAATAKHYPGLGTAGAHNTDLEIVRVDTPAAELTRRATPFRRLARGGVGLVMVSNAIYTALDPRAPAVLSRRIVSSRLRSFFRDGVIISDALEVPALQRYGRQVPVLATNAGVDILLYADTDAGGAYDVLRRAHRAGTLAPGRLKAAYNRITALKARVARGGG